MSSGGETDKGKTERSHHYIHKKKSPLSSPRPHPAFRDLTKPPTPRCLLPHSLWTHAHQKEYSPKQPERSPRIHPWPHHFFRNTRKRPTHHIIIAGDGEEARTAVVRRNPLGPQQDAQLHRETKTRPIREGNMARVLQ